RSMTINCMVDGPTRPLGELGPSVLALSMNQYAKLAGHPGVKSPWRPHPRSGSFAGRIQVSMSVADQSANLSDGPRPPWNQVPMVTNIPVHPGVDVPWPAYRLSPSRNCCPARLKPGCHGGWNP